MNGADTQLAKIRHPIASVEHIPGKLARRPPSGPLRHFLVAQRDFEPDRYEGHGLTLDAVIGEATEHLVASDGSRCPPYDQVIWEGDHVVCVVHSTGDDVGSYLTTRITWPEMALVPATPLADAAVVGGPSKTSRSSPGHPEIRRLVADFEAARRSGGGIDPDPLFNALSGAIKDAGFAAAVVGGRVYISRRLLPETGDSDNEYGCEAFRSDLILDLDALDRGETPVDGQAS